MTKYLISALSVGVSLSILGPETLEAKKPDAKTIKIGMSTALSGPAKALGQGMKAGVEAYFKKINQLGGIHGKKLELIVRDDGYEPSRTAPNMRQLIKKDKVFAILGNVGTPTAIVSVPIANELKTPFFGAFTGAGVLRKTPPDRYVWNYRASYAQETAAMVKGFVKDLKIKPSEIGFFTQNDAYGDAGYEGGIKALKSIGYADAEKLPHGRYTRNTTNVEDGLLEMLEAKVKPKAIIMVGAYKPCAAFIRLAKQEGLKAIFANVSFVGSKALAKDLGPLGEGVVVTQVVPFYQNSKIPVVAEYHQFIKKEELGFVSLEGFIAAKAFIKALSHTKVNATKEDLINALSQMKNFKLGLGEKHSLSSTQHQIGHRVWPTMIKNGAYQEFKWPELSPSIFGH